MHSYMLPLGGTGFATPFLTFLSNRAKVFGYIGVQALLAKQAKPALRL